MGARAVLDIVEDTGRASRFVSPWASPPFQVPHLARFIHDTDAAGGAVTAVAYRAWASDHPGTLPAIEIDPSDGSAGDLRRGDLDYRYRLDLGTTTGMSFTVRERTRLRRKPSWRTTHTLTGRSELYRAAADMCEGLARRSRRLAERTGGTGLLGFPGPDRWRAEAATFTAWLDARDSPGEEVPPMT